MCNHFRKDADWRTEVEDWSETKIPPRWAQLLGPSPNAEIKEHIYPAGLAEILVGDGDGLAALAANWRWVPPDFAGSYKAYGRDKNSAGRNNCRSEYADTTKTWREVARTGRCLIPLHAFFEYGTVVDDKGRKVEHQFTWPDGRLMFAAGLWCRSDLVEEGPMTTFTMLTKQPGGDTASIGHHRQPVILRDDELADYLDPTNPIFPLSLIRDPEFTFTVKPVERPAPAAPSLL